MRRVGWSVGWSLRGALVAAGAALGCVSAPAGSTRSGGDEGGGATRVIVVGDQPYDTLQAPGWRRLLGAIDRERADVVVHVGDFTGFLCTDSVFAERLAEFRRVAHPLVFTPGDNDWTDCHRNGRDPAERLAVLRRDFLAGDSSLGRRRVALVRQSADPAWRDYRENVRWSMGGVVFATLHVVGSNNNRGRTAAADSEFVARDAADRAWLRLAFEAARREDARGLALFFQANPFERPRPPRGAPPGTPAPPGGFDALLAEFRALAAAYPRPIAVVHGDTHYYRVDKPFRDDSTGALVLPHVTRIETFGSPDTHGLVLTVAPTATELFRVAPLLAPSR